MMGTDQIQHRINGLIKGNLVGFNISADTMNNITTQLTADVMDVIDVIIGFRRNQKNNASTPEWKMLLPSTE